VSIRSLRSTGDTAEVKDICAQQEKKIMHRRRAYNRKFMPGAALILVNMIETGSSVNSLATVQNQGQKGAL
jgi:hypothetical protein